MNLLTAEKLAAGMNVSPRTARRALEAKFGRQPAYLLTDAQAYAIIETLRKQKHFKFSRLDPDQTKRA